MGKKKKANIGKESPTQTLKKSTLAPPETTCPQTPSTPLPIKTKLQQCAQ
jgi:hypothetical protein